MTTKATLTIDVSDFERVTHEQAGEALSRLAGCWAQPFPRFDYRVTNADAQLKALHRTAVRLGMPCARELEVALAWVRAAKLLHVERSK